jgi:hypothetical protein
MAKALGRIEELLNISGKGIRYEHGIIVIRLRLRRTMVEFSSRRGRRMQNSTIFDGFSQGDNVEGREGNNHIGLSSTLLYAVNTGTEYEGETIKITGFCEGGSISVNWDRKTRANTQLSESIRTYPTLMLDIGRYSSKTWEGRKVRPIGITVL